MGEFIISDIAFMLSSMDGIPSPPPGMDFIRSSSWEGSIPACFIMSSREALDDGGASSAPAPPLGTRKGGDFTLDGTAAAPTAACPYERKRRKTKEHVSEVEVEGRGKKSH